MEEARRRRDQIVRDTREEDRRLWEAFSVEKDRVTRLEVQAVERHREIRDNIRDCSNNVVSLRAELQKQREGTTAQRVAYVGLAGLVLASLIGGIAQVVSALG